MSLKISNITNAVILNIALILCSGCEQDHYYNKDKAEIINMTRLAAEGDNDAITGMMFSENAENDPRELKLWADRLSWKDVSSGFHMSAYSRYEIAKDLNLDDPERLALLIEAKEFGRRAIESRPGSKAIYVGRGGLFEDFDREIKRSRDSLQKKYGIVKPLEPNERISEYLKSKGIK